jgi:hypothetical protein
MPKLCAIVVIALGIPLIVSCERTAQTASKTSAVVPGTLAVNSDQQTPSDSDVAVPVDSLVVTDTADADFTPEDLNAVKSAVESRLQQDQFTASGPAAEYGKACRFYDTTSVRRYTGEDVRVAFVRPRLIKIAFAGNDHYVRRVNVAAEITRVGLVQRGADGKWHGAVNVSRDTLSVLVSSSVSDSSWTVCEKPGHLNANSPQDTITPWIPVHPTDVDRMGVVWDGNFTTPRVRQLADSISKLPSTVIVEGNPEPPMPKIYKDVCPGEGCEFGEWLICDTLRVFTAAGHKEKTAFMLQRGDRFTALTGDLHVTQAGKVIFHRKVNVNEEGTNFTFTPADTLYPLLYGGEGYGNWYFRGKESGGSFFFGNADQEATDIPLVAGVSGYEVVRPIISAWWVKVRASNGREGWVLPRRSIYGMSPHYEEMPKSCPAEKGQ